MGSLPKADGEVQFVLTGFSNFHGVPKNPTEELVTEFKDFWRTSWQRDESCLFDCSTLRVSAQACDQYLAQMTQRVAQELLGKRVVWIHFGVDPGAKEIAVESQAVNNASFLSPDEDGCQFMCQSIDAKFPYDEAIVSSIDIDAVIQRVSQSDIQLRKSFDAGRFICNWIYFRSLRYLSQYSQCNWHSLFVHVPQFHHIPKETQLQAIASLIDAIGSEIERAKAGVTETRLPQAASG